MAVNVDTKMRVRELLQEAINLLQESQAASTAPATSANGGRPENDDTDLVRLSGIVSWPKYRDARGIPLFTFNLGVRRMDAKLEWMNMVVWRKTALWAMEHIHRNDEVTILGRWETQEWADRETGELKTKNVFIVNHFERVDEAA